MIISIASGKGGTGKTMVATSFALSLFDREVTFLDCDVEEPNSAIFLKPVIEKETVVNKSIPEINDARCNLCGVCEKVCAYNAIAVVNKVLIFPDLCHGCGACSMLCPENAIREIGVKIGIMRLGIKKNIRFIEGRLKINEPMATPLIRRVKNAEKKVLVIVDSPPGTSCPVMESVKNSDYVILVTEATPFGLSDLEMAFSTFKELGLRMGVIINKSRGKNKAIEEFCEKKGLEVLMKIPFDRKIAESYSRGTPLVEIMPEYANKFKKVYSRIESEVQR
jgi:MinD superfamily P-loop ATPase